MTDHEDNVPFIKPEQNPHEFTWVAVIVGIALAVIFCAANAYLGLRVGMTVSASIPAAVISMAVLRILLRRQSVLENNLVQTIASAGESLAAGVIFTLPAFFLWQKEGVAKAPSIAGIILLLDKAWGFGSHELPAPQAHLMKLVCEGAMNDSMAWSLVLTGASISLAMECLGVSSLCVAIGVFLPMNNNVTIFLGGLTRFLVEKKAGSDSENGVLMSSGFIAGEGVLGILLALLTVLNLDGLFDISKIVTLGFWGPATVLVVTMLLLFLCSRRPSGTKGIKMPESEQ